ncbi:hypothetical protein AM305_06009, partial [Actinobacillus minor NM305]
PSLATQTHRVNSRTTVILAIKMGDLITDKFKINGFGDLANKMVFGNQLLKTYHLELILGRRGIFKHRHFLFSICLLDQTSREMSRGLSAV